MVDERLAALGTDYIDLFFVHGLGDGWKLDKTIDFITGKEFRKAADAIRKSGKARFIGFSSHHKDRAAIIKAAAEAGIVDAIMLQYAPWLDKDSPLNQALDVAWNRGVGLISMKQIASANFGDKPKVKILDEVKRRVPTLAERNLTRFPGHAPCDLDRRAHHRICVSMRNTDHHPRKRGRCPAIQAAQDRRYRSASRRRPRPGPDPVRRLRRPLHGGRGHAGRAGQHHPIPHLPRGAGRPAHARQRIRQAAARSPRLVRRRSRGRSPACPSQLNFAQLLPEAEKHLA